MKKKLFIISIITVASLIGAKLISFYKSPELPKSHDEGMDTIQRVGGAPGNVLIDFEQCTKDLKRIDVAFGSTTIKIEGKDAGTCILLFGGEVENPNWDGKLPNRCSVPTTLGKMSFNIGAYGVNLSSIKNYCIRK